MRAEAGGEPPRAAQGESHATAEDPKQAGGSAGGSTPGKRPRLSCKACEKPAIHANYGYCLDHRNPKAGADKSANQTARRDLCKACEKPAIQANYGYCLDHRNAHTIAAKAQKVGRRQCKSCDKPAVQANYGYCLDHRNADGPTTKTPNNNGTTS